MTEASRHGRFGTRVLWLLFYAVSAMLAIAPWIRPPLSPDIGGLQTSLGVLSPQAAPEALLQGTRTVPADSVGLVLLLVIAAAAVAAWWRGRVAIAAGAVLAAALAANVAVLFNHPVLMEHLDSERQQRQQVVRVLGYAPDADPLSTASNGRVPPADSGSDPLLSDLTRPADYLLFGRWLVVWAALGVWFGTRHVSRRWMHLSAWTAAGLVLGGTLCFTRLRAEFHWIAASQYERSGRLDEARRSLSKAVRFADLQRLHRTWMLAGKLDHFEGRDTLAVAMYRAAQISATAEPAGTNPAESLPSNSQLREATAILEPLLAVPFEGREAAHALAARILSKTGVALFTRAPVFTDDGLDYREQEQRLTGAQEAWKRAARLDPGRLDVRLYVSMSQTLLDPRHPERAEVDARIADRLLQADLLNLIGDAYFAAGRAADARRRYAESLDLLNLPQRKNFRAQKGLGGL